MVQKKFKKAINKQNEQADGEDGNDRLPTKADVTKT